MIITRSKSLDTPIKCNKNFISVITDDNAIAFLKRKSEGYTKTFNLTDIDSGLTKQNDQYYFFEHDITNTPKRFYSRNSIEKNFSYKVYPITDDLAQRIINKEYVNKWEILFNAFANYQKVYTMVKDYSIRLTYLSSDVKEDKLVIPYSISPTGTNYDIILEEFLINHNKKYGGKKESLSINLDVLRDLKLKELNI